MIRTRMTIKLEQYDQPDRYDTKSKTPYGEEITFSYEDVSEFNIHELFNAFEKVAKTLGYSDSVIMVGGCEIAFNEFRDTEDMVKVAKEYDLSLNEMEMD